MRARIKNRRAAWFGLASLVVCGLGVGVALLAHGGWFVPGAFLLLALLNARAATQPPPPRR